MPQNKRTEGIQELEELTEPEYQFLMAGMSGKVRSHAYGEAFQHQDWSRESLEVSSSRLWNSSKFRLWRAALAQDQRNKGNLEMDEHQAVLESLRDEARNSGNLGAAVQAEVNRGKAAGLYVERHEDISSGPDIRELPLNELISAIQSLQTELERRKTIIQAEALDASVGDHIGSTQQ